MEGGVTYRSIGKYKVTGVLGRGSMGIVYKAQDPEIGRTVAIKVLRKRSDGATPQQGGDLELFKSEARAAGNLRHPNIITVFEVNTDGETPYIVMDYVMGEGLDRLISRGAKLEPAIALSYLQQIAAGLDHAHSNGIIHRDIKPSNIRIDNQGVAYVLDFGVALITSAVYGDAGKIVGSPAYMSPEQFLNEKLDYRSDLFSLGVVAFECFTSKRPFPGKSFKELAANILKTRPLSIQEIVKELPLSLEAELEKALAKDPEQRFQSGAAMTEAFAQALGLKSNAGANLPARRKRKLSEWIAFVPKTVRSEHQSDSQNSGASLPVSSGGGYAASSSYGSSYSVAKAKPVSPYRAPGDIFKDRNEHLYEHVPLGRNGVTRAVIGVLALVCITLGVMLLLKVFYGSGKVEKPDSSYDLSQSVAVSGANDAALDGLGETQLLAVLVDFSVGEARIIEGIREVQRRRLFGFIDVAEKLLKHDSYVIRKETVRALAGLGDRRAVPILVTGLDDYDPLVRNEVVKALTTLADARSLSYLNNRLKVERVESVRQALQNAIGRISGVPVS